MKLVHQINLAFGLSLALILSVTAVLLHYVLLDHFIGAQKNDLKTLSAAMSASLTKAGDFALSPVLSSGTVPLPDLNSAGIQSVQTGTGEAVAVPTTLIPAGVEAFVTDLNGNVLSGTLPVNGTPVVVSNNATLTEVAPVNMQQYTAVTSSSIKDLWKGTDGRYVMDVSPIPQGTLTLLTPMSKI
jgi:hypothetical protein